MALSNAERQARYRQRLKERASPTGIVAAARELADQSASIMWAFIQRTGVADADGCADLVDFRAEVAASDGSLPDRCRQYLLYPDDLTDEERRAFEAIVETYDALMLASYRPQKPKRRRR